MSRGRFGIHGGQFISEAPMSAVTELGEACEYYKKDSQFTAKLKYLLGEYTGRPSHLYYAEKMIGGLGGVKIYLKREGLNHTGPRKINNALGQILPAEEIGKTRVIAEIGVRQHDVATTTTATPLELEHEVYMGKGDTDRQVLSVYRMELLGVEVHPVTSGTQTLKGTINETLRRRTNHISDTCYVIGSVIGPHPFLMMVRDFQSIIGRETREQLVEKEGKFSDTVVACVGDGSSATGVFYKFADEKDVKLVGYEAVGLDVETEQTAVIIVAGQLRIFHDMKFYFCQDEYGQVTPMYSISASLDYLDVGLEHTQLHDSGRAVYAPVTGDEAVGSFEYPSRMEGIIPAAENARTVAYTRKVAGSMGKNQITIINLSSREGKDMASIARYKEVKLYG